MFVCPVGVVGDGCCYVLVFGGFDEAGNIVARGLACLSKQAVRWGRFRGCLRLKVLTILHC